MSESFLNLSKIALHRYRKIKPNKHTHTHRKKNTYFPTSQLNC